MVCCKDIDCVVMEWTLKCSNVANPRIGTRLNTAPAKYVGRLVNRQEYWQVFSVYSIHHRKSLISLLYVQVYVVEAITLLSGIHAGFLARGGGGGGGDFVAS